MKRRPSLIHGVLVIDKPAQMTSHDVVDRVRRLTGERRVGHTGTLDPMATGLLPVCVGQATRLAEYLTGETKSYRATVRLGEQTATDDADGPIIAVAPVPSLTSDQLEELLRSFRGAIAQLPPAYAAIKQDGRKLYELARAGLPVITPPRAVRIDRLEIEAWERPDLTLIVECSKGTYIRSLARDIGAALGCGGHITHLRRLRSGALTIDQAIPLAELSDRLATAGWAALAVPADRCLPDWPTLYLDATAAENWRQGRAVLGPGSSSGQVNSPHEQLARVYGPDGAFIGVARKRPVADEGRPSPPAVEGRSSPPAVERRSSPPAAPGQAPLPRDAAPGAEALDWWQPVKVMVGGGE